MSALALTLPPVEGSLAPDVAAGLELLARSPPAWPGRSTPSLGRHSSAARGPSQSAGTRRLAQPDGLASNFTA
jgi:hypothetical protein